MTKGPWKKILRVATSFLPTTRPTNTSSRPLSARNIPVKICILCRQTRTLPSHTMSSKSSGPSLIQLSNLFSIVEPGVYRCASPTAIQVSPIWSSLNLAHVSPSLIISTQTGPFPCDVELEDDHLTHSRTSHQTFPKLHPNEQHRFRQSIHSSYLLILPRSKSNWHL